MSNQPDLDAFGAALACWVNDAVDFMASDIDRYVQIERIENWQLCPDGYYKRLVADVYVWKLVGWPNRETADELQELPAYKELLRIALETAPLSKMFDNLVGSVSSRSSFDFFLAVALRALPSAEVVVRGDAYSVDDLCRSTIERVTATHVERVTVIYLQGFGLSSDRLELAPDLTIERLNACDVVSGLRCGILKPFIPELPIFRLDEVSAFAVKRRWRTPLVIGEPTQAQTDQEASDYDQANLIVERLSESVALMTDKRLAVTGALTILDALRLSGGHAWTTHPFPGPRPGHGKIYLDDAQSAQLQQLWDRPSDVSAQGKALELAIRRLSFATQRERWDDRLLDLFVAAEAFYLTDVGDAKDRGELKYRLALRAGYWADNNMPGWDRREVFDHMKRGYDLRSAIVHGSTPRAKDIRVKGEQVDLKEFVTTTEEILRAAIHKALAQIEANKRLSISWDSMVLQR